MIISKSLSSSSSSSSVLCVSAGKKGSELGEYDPLTQAASEDESEEDDLVLNYPRNGLGRDGCLGAASSKLRGGRSRRLDEEQDDDEDEEEEQEEWRERLHGKPRHDRDDMMGTQYWSQRDSGRDRRAGEERRGSGPLGGTVLGGHGPDAEEKAARRRNMVRSAFFLVPLVCATLVVLFCAFLIPCQKKEPKPQWERALGDAGGKRNNGSIGIFDTS